MIKIRLNLHVMLVYVPQDTPTLQPLEEEPDKRINAAFQVKGTSEALPSGEEASASAPGSAINKDSMRGIKWLIPFLSSPIIKVCIHTFP